MKPKDQLLFNDPETRLGRADRAGMASIIPFKSSGVLPRGASGPAAGESLVAMSHIDLEIVVETVRLLRELGKLSLLDDFNGRGHAARAQAQAKSDVVLNAPGSFRIPKTS